jgi:hypothetical protein
MGGGQLLYITIASCKTCGTLFISAASSVRAFRQEMCAARCVTFRWPSDVPGCPVCIALLRQAGRTSNSATVKKAEQRIESCEHCHPDDAEIPFDWLLAVVTGKRGPYEFILTEPAHCPTCKHPVTEKTLVNARTTSLTLPLPHRASPTIIATSTRGCLCSGALESHSRPSCVFCH